MRDREHAEAVLGGHRLDPARHVAQRVDVEAGVDLVEHRELRLEHRELQRLGPLLLAAGELDVDAAREELVVRPRGARASAATRVVQAGGVAAPAATAAPSKSPSARPGTSTGYCIARNRPAAARCSVGRPSSSSPSMVTEPPVTS